MRKNGLSIVEIVSVASIVAFLAAVLVPLVIRDDRLEIKALLDFNTRTIQSQIAAYAKEHAGNLPKIVAGSLPQLIYATSANGTIGECGPKFPYGPYLPDGIPENPCDGSCAVTCIESPGRPPSRPLGTLGGWLYDPSNGNLYPNDAEGLRLMGYTSK